MAGPGTEYLAVGSNRFAELARAEQNSQDVSAGEGQQQTPETERWINFQTQSTQPQVRLPVAEGQLDVHPFAVEFHDLCGGQSLCRVGRDQQEPRFLEVAVMENHNINGFSRGVLISGVGVTTRMTQTMGQAPQTDALSAGAHDGVAAATNEVGDVQ